MANPAEVLAYYRGRGVLLDTNLLLLYAVGSWSKASVPTFKRTAAYLPEDFDLLRQVLLTFSRLFTTPHILAETSNLLFQLAQPGRDVALAALRAFALSSTERMPHATSIVGSDSYFRFGVTDTALRLASRACLVLTDDLRLASHLSELGVATVNFNHLRTMVW